MLRISLTTKLNAQGCKAFSSAIINQPLVPSSSRNHFYQSSKIAKSRSFHASSSSYEGMGIMSGIRKSFTDRQQRKQKEQFADQVKRMSDTDIWTVKDFVDDISKSVNSWRTKLPGMSNLQQVKSAKRALSIAEAMMENVGKDATAADLSQNITRADKLRVAIKCDIDVEEVNGMLKQLESVSLMHRIIRRRKLNGEPLPSSEESMRAIMQTDALKTMSKSQKKSMQKEQMKRGMRGIGR